MSSGELPPVSCSSSACFISRSLIRLSTLRKEHDDCRSGQRWSGVVVLRNHIARVELDRLLHESRGTDVEESVGHG